MTLAGEFLKSPAPIFFAGLNEVLFFVAISPLLWKTP